jgi:hypothetical protein
MMRKCGIHNANRQALDLADPKILAAAMLTFVIAAQRKRGASLRPCLDRVMACNG